MKNTPEMLEDKELHFDEIQKQINSITRHIGTKIKPMIFATYNAGYERGKSDGCREGRDKGYREGYDKCYEVLINDGCEGCTHEFAKDMSHCEYCMYNYTSKYETIKPKDDEIRIGDEVIAVHSDTNPYVVTRIVGYGHDVGYYGVGVDGRHRGCLGSESDFTKTGRHFDEVEKLLKAMESEND